MPIGLAPAWTPLRLEAGGFRSFLPILICLLAVAQLLAVAASAQESAADSQPPAAESRQAAGGDDDGNEDHDDRRQRRFGLRRLGYDTRFLLRRPSALDRRDRRLVMATLATAGGLYLLRDEIREIAARNRSASRTRLLDDVRLMGKGRFGAGLAVSLVVVSLATGNDREKETAQMVLESMAFSSLLAGTGAMVLATQRPEDGDSVRFFHRSGRGVSVDAALAASLVEPLRCQYLRVGKGDTPSARFWKRTASGLLYTGAGLVASQRIDADKHWAPDAFLGLMTGLAVGRTLCEAHGLRRRPRWRFAASPTPGGAYLGLSLHLGAGRITR